MVSKPALSNSLSVLYIEENKEDQLALRRVLNNSINAEVMFDTAATAEAGIRKIKSFDYDLVFLDYRLPDKTGLEFLEEIRGLGKTVPVIFLTGIEKENMTVQSMSSGVKDYIVKSDIHSNKFIDTIRNRLIEETDRRRKVVELSGLEERALSEIEWSGSSELVLESDNGFIYYRGLKEFTEKNGVEATSVVLESLWEKGVIRETGCKRIVMCPICSSGVTDTDMSSYTCPSCKSESFERVKFMRHPFCGYTGDRRSFVTEDGLVCPNCKVELPPEPDTVEDYDKGAYIVLGSAFECSTCSTKFHKPEVLHSCIKCGERFTYKNMGYMSLREYRLA